MLQLAFQYAIAVHSASGQAGCLFLASQASVGMSCVRPPVNVATLQCAAQEQLEEDLAKEGEEGDLNLDQNLLNEYSKLKETAMARASKPTRDCATQEAQLKASARMHFCRLRRAMLQP